MFISDQIILTVILIKVNIFRFSKKYRHPDLDTSLTKERLRAEAKALVLVNIIQTLIHAGYILYV